VLTRTLTRSRGAQSAPRTLPGKAPVMTRTALAHMATRDEILATRTGSLASYSATSDTGVSYAVLGPVPADPDRVYVTGRAGTPSAGLVILVTRTGRVDVRGHGAQVRVRFDFPRDTGDAGGTLSFDAGHVGGVAPRVLFG